jgi:hypothetical protein
MIKRAAVMRALSWVVSAGVVTTIVAGPLAGVADAAPKSKTPPPAVTGVPTAPTNSTSANFTWTPQASTSYTCWIDGAKLASCPPATASNLKDGTHTFTVKAQTTGLRPVTKSYSWTVDTKPPAAPSIVQPPSPTSATAVSVQFSDSDSSTARFTCALDGAAATDCSSPFVDNGPLSETTHTLVVAAYDLAGNFSTASTTWVVDHTAPNVPVVAGPASPTKNTGATINFSADPTATLTCALDAVVQSTCASPVVIAGPLAEGAHEFTVTAKDLAGNTSVGKADWVVDLTPPAAPAIVSGPADPTNDTSPDITFSDSDLSAATFSCTVTNVTTATVVEGPEACSSPYSPTAATLDGDRYSVAITAADQAGNVSAPVSDAWTVDLTAAPPAFVSAPASPSNVTQPSFSFTATDPSTVKFTCTLDGVVTDPCSGVPNGTFTPSSPLADGSHTFSVTAFDGTVTSAPVSWVWTVDTTAPSVPTFSELPSAITNATAATFGFSDAENNVVLSCTLDGAVAPCASPVSFTGLAPGSHTFAVVATDQAQNASAPATFTWTVDTTAPTVTVSTPTTLTGAAVVKFNEKVHGLVSGALKLTVTGSSTALSAWGGCYSGTTHVACGSSYDSIRLIERSALLPGQHYTVSLAAGATHDLAGNATPPASKSFRALRSVQENTPSARDSWARVSSSSAYGGSYVLEHLAGARASWTFTGTSVTWWTVTGKAQGKAYLLVDGVRKATVDNYAASTHYRVARRVTGLASKKHTVTIQVLGVKGSRYGTGTWIAVDAFSVGSTLVKTPSLAMTWRHAYSTRFSGHYASVADRAGATLTFAFRGTAVSWYTEKARSMGQVKVYIDGVYKGTLDNYATTTAYGVQRYLGHLTDKVHTLKLVVTGHHHSGGTGTAIVVDRFYVS